MSNPITGEEPAFACASEHFNQDGLSIRAYFAGQALPSVIRACVHDRLNPGEQIAEMFARKACELADALITELNKPKP